MSLQSLDDNEKRVVFECLRAAVKGPFFPDWEFHTLFGLQRDEVARIVAALPNIDDTNESVFLAINNSMNSLLGYPHGEAAAWGQFISVPEAEVMRIFYKWKHEQTNAYQITAHNAGWRSQFRYRGLRHWSGVCEFYR